MTSNLEKKVFIYNLQTQEKCQHLFDCFIQHSRNEKFTQHGHVCDEFNLNSNQTRLLSVLDITYYLECYHLIWFCNMHTS